MTRGTRGTRRTVKGAWLAAAGFAAMVVASAGHGTGASASELVYRPINPIFGGNPFNSTILLETAKLQDDFDHRSSGGPNRGLTPQQQFTRTLQNRLLSALASQVTEAIFGDEPQDEGEFRYGEQVVTFSRGLENIIIEIVDETTGERTEISVPTSANTQ